MNKFSAHWDKLRTFYQVISIGTFSGAAEVLNTSQSVLSRSIIILEKHIQTRLFERSPRGLVLTRQGEVLFEAVRKINSEINKKGVIIPIINKNNFTVILGNALEYYDFMLYEFFTNISSPSFFSE